MSVLYDSHKGKLDFCMYIIRGKSWYLIYSGPGVSREICS
jgi:hypothetical protein